MTSSRDFDERRRQQLGLTSDLLHTFLDWRHKVMTRFAVVVGAIVIAINNLYRNNSSEYLIVSAYTVGAVLSFTAFLMDRTNQRVLYRAYRNGTHIEDRLAEPGVFHQLECLFVRRSDWHPCHHMPDGSSMEQVFRKEAPKVWLSRFTQYRRILAAVYLGTMSLFVIAGAFEVSGDGFRRPSVFVSNPCNAEVVVEQVLQSRDRVAPSAAVRPLSTQRIDIERGVSRIAVTAGTASRVEVEVAGIANRTYVVPATDCQ